MSTVTSATARRHGGALVLAGVAGGVSGVLVHIICARVLGPLSYGTFGSLVSATAAGEVWRFSTQVQTTSEVASGVHAKQAVKAVWGKMFRSIPALVVVCALVSTYASVGGYTASLAGAVFVLSSVWSAGRRGAALGAGMTSSAAAGLMVCAVSRVALSLAGALFWGVPGAMIGGALAELLGGLSVKLPNGSPAATPSLPTKANWLVMSGLSLSPPGADVLVMTPHLAAASASAYAAASAFSRGALIVGQLLLLSYLPTLYRDGRAEFMRKGRHAVMVAAALSAAGSVGAPLILSGLADKQLVSAAAFLAGFVCVACGAYVNMVSYSMLSSKEYLKNSMLVAWSGIFLVTAASLVVRPATVEAASGVLAVTALCSAALAAFASRRVS